MSGKESKKKETEETIEVILGSQYGSDQQNLGKGKIDERRFTNINEAEAFVIPYFMNIPPHRGGNWARKYISNFLNLKMGVNGWRSNQGIKVISGSKGAPTIDVRKRPGLIGRNVTERDWKKKSEQDGAVIVE